MKEVTNRTRGKKKGGSEEFEKEERRVKKGDRRKGSEAGWKEGLEGSEK